MSRQVLYRVYRPDTFAGVIGQDTVITALSRALESGRLAHSYMFSGPRGCGKTSCARIFARCLNCEKGPTPTPCGVCPSCKDLANGGPGSIDVIELDAASNNGVDNARELRERLNYAPNRDRFKILILDEAHRITKEAFDALLKIVEEPPEHVKFIFATTEPEKVKPTIRSRTYHYAFSLVPPAIMTPFLQDIVKKEKIEVDERVYPLLTRIGGGSVRDTLSNLDQLISSAKDDKVDYDFAVSLFGFTPAEVIKSTLELLQTGNFAETFNFIEEIINQGISPKGYALDLLTNLRDSLLAGLLTYIPSESAAEGFKTALSEYSEADLTDLKEFATTVDTNIITKYIAILDKGIRSMGGITSERLVLELVFAQFAAVTTTACHPRDLPQAGASATSETLGATQKSKNETLNRVQGDKRDNAPQTTPEKPTEPVKTAPEKPTPAPIAEKVVPEEPAKPTEFNQNDFVDYMSKVDNRATTVLRRKLADFKYENNHATMRFNPKFIDLEKRFLDEGLGKYLTEEIKKDKGVTVQVTITPNSATEPVTSAPNVQPTSKPEPEKAPENKPEKPTPKPKATDTDQEPDISDNDEIVQVGSDLESIFESEFGAVEVKE